MTDVQSEPDVIETGMDETFEKRTYSSVDEMISDLEAAISSIEMVKTLAEGMELDIYRREKPIMELCQSNLKEIDDVIWSLDKSLELKIYTGTICDIR